MSVLLGARKKEGPQGERGKDGEQGLPGLHGEQGPMPKHEWRGTELRFEIEPGVWGEWVDLKGKKVIFVDRHRGGIRNLRGQVKIMYNEITLSGEDSDLLLEEEVPANRVWRVLRARISGENVGLFTVKTADTLLVETLHEKCRTNFAQFDKELVFEGLTLKAGEKFIVEAENGGITSAEFNATLFVDESLDVVI